MSNLFLAAFKTAIANINGKFIIFSDDSSFTKFQLLDSGCVECTTLSKEMDQPKWVANIFPFRIDSDLDSEALADAIVGLFNGNGQRFDDLLTEKK